MKAKKKKWSAKKSCGVYENLHNASEYTKGKQKGLPLLQNARANYIPSNIQSTNFVRRYSTIPVRQIYPMGEALRATKEETA